MENQSETASASAFSSTLSSRSKTIAATGLFAALAVLLTSISQFLVLSFPLVPYLQFDLGEVAIVLAFLLFGPVPAVTAGFVEFITLMGIGQNVPWGPILKLIAILSSIGGLWLGTIVARSLSKNPKRSSILGSALGFGLVSRMTILTVANYYLVVVVYGLFSGYDIAKFVTAPMKLIGLTVTSSNALFLVLSFTAVFNALQLTLVFTIAYLLVREPHVMHSLRSNRVAWFQSLGKRIEP